MFSHSTPIIPRGSFQVKCEKIWGSFGVGDHFGSCLGRFWGSFDVGDHLGSGIISSRVHIRSGSFPEFKMADGGEGGRGKNAFFF